MQTRKYPRTLTEAFGPYTDNQIHEPEPDMHTHDRMVVVASALALIGLGIMVVAGWL